MDNHVHLILVPQTADGLRGALADAHRRYSRRVNFCEGWRGYLFQGRFASYPMDDAHLMRAIRYVENNPVAAGMVKRAEEWHWSSAASHIAGARTADDPLTNVAALGQHVANWRALLRVGLEALDVLASAETIEARIRTGRPLAMPEWIAEAEAAIDRKLGPARRGPKPGKGVNADANQYSVPRIPRNCPSPELPAVVTGCMDRQDYPNDVRREVLANAAVGGGSIAQLARGGQDYDLHFFGAQLIDWSEQIE